MDSTKNLSFDLKIKSVYIPESRNETQKNKSMDFLSWMAYTINSVHYCNDRKMSNALLTFNK
jgi:hypothetical protein